jgi:Ca-activated chloride channel family protein
VILATDGDFNVGQTTDEELEKMITLHQQSGIYLTCLGVGHGQL